MGDGEALAEFVARQVFLYCGDITRIRCSAIVNAANTSLGGGGGVDGAIHRAAGPALADACAAIREQARMHNAKACPTGEVRVTPGFSLPTRHILHTAGPIRTGAHLLRACYLNCLKELPKLEGCSSVAFPCISTGVYAFPKPEALTVIKDALTEWCKNPDSTKFKIIFCCFDKSDFDDYVREFPTAQMLPAEYLG